MPAVDDDGERRTAPRHIHGETGTLAGEGLCIERDSGDTVSQEYKAPRLG